MRLRALYNSKLHQKQRHVSKGRVHVSLRSKLAQSNALRFLLPKAASRPASSIAIILFAKPLAEVSNYTLSDIEKK